MPLGKPTTPDVRVGTYRCKSITVAPVGILLVPLQSPHRGFGEQARFLQSHLGITNRQGATGWCQERIQRFLPLPWHEHTGVP